MKENLRTILRCTSVVLVVVGALVLLPAAAEAGDTCVPGLHGASIFKSCVSPKNTCTSDADCSDDVFCNGPEQCTTETSPGSNVVDCTITLFNPSEHCDDLTVTEACDTITGGTGVPSSSCDILVVTAPGGTGPGCDAGSNLGGAEICTLNPGEFISFRSNFYTIQPADPDPLGNQASVTVVDTCSGGANGGCSTTPSNAQFSASTDLQSGCSPGTPVDCPDDGNLCDGPEFCDEAIDACNDGPDVVCTDDSNVCNGVPVCIPATGLCEDTDAADSTTCGDTDDNACTTAGCDGAGTCDQTHNTVTCNDDGNVCNGPESCNPANGSCVSGPDAADSTVCGDTDAIACTTAGCDGLGTCDQNHINTCTTGCGFLLIDEDSIDNGNPPNFFDNISSCSPSGCDVNDDIARIGLREELQWFDENFGAVITLWTGTVGDEGWFALEQIPQKWNTGGQVNGLSNFLSATTGLGSGKNPEKFLDKIPHVNPLRATGLEQLENSNACICAVVYDSDISINYDNPINGSLKGANLGIVAFEVIDVSLMSPAQSSGSLPMVQIQVLDADTVCSAPLSLFDAPTLQSSSVPYDVNPDP